MRLWVPLYTITCRVSMLCVDKHGFEWLRVFHSMRMCAWPWEVFSKDQFVILTSIADPNGNIWTCGQYEHVDNKLRKGHNPAHSVEAIAVYSIIWRSDIPDNAKCILSSKRKTFFLNVHCGSENKINGIGGDVKGSLGSVGGAGKEVTIVDALSVLNVFRDTRTLRSS